MNRMPDACISHLNTLNRIDCFKKYMGAFLVVSGERLNGIQEVSGSIPLISTKKKSVIVMIADFFLSIK